MTKARREYTDEEKAAALAALRLHGGDASKAAREMGIPRQTLLRWRDSAPDVVRQIGQDKTDGIAVMMDRIARRAAGLVEKGMDYIDSATLADEDGNVTDISGAVAAKALPELNRVMGTAVDKGQLLRGDPTSNTRIQIEYVNDWRTRANDE